MTHDPLCPWYGSTEFETVVGCDDCGLIAKVRKDESQHAFQWQKKIEASTIDKCIAIAARYIDRGGYSPAQFMDDLEGLREVDTPETEPIEHINLFKEQP